MNTTERKQMAEWIEKLRVFIALSERTGNLTHDQALKLHEIGDNFEAIAGIPR